MTSKLSNNVANSAPQMSRNRKNLNSTQTLKAVLVEAYSKCMKNLIYRLHAYIGSGSIFKSIIKN